MPKITDFQSFLEEHVLNVNSQPQYRLGLPLTPFIQHGQTCKLNALRTVMHALHEAHGMTKPLPLTKKEGNSTYSLRQLAKEKYRSKVGEVYSAKTLVSIAVDNGFTHSSIYVENHFEHYMRTIIKAVDAKEAPIIFYDIDLKGDPSPSHSNREHAVVVAGYFFDKNQHLNLIVSQWGGYYWARAIDIFYSANQLSSNRSPEVFFKYEKGWFDLANMGFAPLEYFKQEPSECRRADPLPEGDGGLRNTIVVLHKPPIKMNAFSFWSTPITSLTPVESETLFLDFLNRNGVKPLRGVW